LFQGLRHFHSRLLPGHRCSHRGIPICPLLFSCWVDERFI
jgi:hypothetical protein